MKTLTKEERIAYIERIVDCVLNDPDTCCDFIESCIRYRVKNWSNSEIIKWIDGDI